MIFLNHTENYLDKYILCDIDITEIKPSLEEYLNLITKINYNIHPFISQLKTRENYFKQEKNEIVNESISKYLEIYGKQINIELFIEKLKNTNNDKIYLLWKSNKFCIDFISNDEINNVILHSINKNNIELKSNNTIYKLLLRWRNHKGILNPAWQISMTRLNNSPSKKENIINIMKDDNLSKLNKPNLNNKSMINDEFNPISKKFNKSLSKEIRSNEGIFFTPKKARDILFAKLDTLDAEFNPQTILEPSFGSGEFLDDIKHKYTLSQIYGVEKNEKLYNEYNMDDNESCLTIYCDDFLEWKSNIKYDLIVGNPPYFITKIKNTSIMTGRPNIYVLFLYKCIEEHLNDNGILAFIIPTSIYNCSYYQPMRDYIYNNCSILHLETLEKVGFYETNTETCLIILKKEKTNNNSFIFNSNKIYFSPYYRELTELSQNKTSISELGLGVKTGNIVWNQVKDKLADNGTLLIYSANISNSTLTIGNIGDNRAKKQYISKIKETIKEPVILVERGYGNSYKFNHVFIDDATLARIGEFYAENHINVIYAKTVESQVNLKIVNESLSKEKSRDFLRYFIGNGMVSASDINDIIPIFL
jgi:adenine-specific DNA-methyltransferase